LFSFAPFLNHLSELFCATYCIDDLGTEHNIPYFGSDCNVMAEIILSRYDHFIENKARYPLDY
jgi:hypothetical protein